MSHEHHGKDVKEAGKAAYEGLVDKAHDKEQEGVLTAQQTAHFELVSGAMESIVGPGEELHIPRELRDEEKRALEFLHRAKTGVELETGEHISGVERNAYLNRALQILQPVLAIGLAPSFDDGHKKYSKLVGNVKTLKKEIKQQILKEMGRGGGKKKEDDDDYEDTGDDDENDDTGDDDDADDDADDANDGDDADDDDDEDKPKAGFFKRAAQRLTGGGTSDGSGSGNK